MNSKILKLTLKRKWFAMVANGDKRDEYRKEKAWIMSRLLDRDGREAPYDLVEFRNGYGENVPMIRLKYRGFSRGTGRKAWGAIPGEQYIRIHLGELVAMANWNPDSMVAVKPENG